jgi:hypothetical protein
MFTASWNLARKDDKKDTIVNAMHAFLDENGLHNTHDVPITESVGTLTRGTGST